MVDLSVNCPVPSSTNSWRTYNVADRRMFGHTPMTRQPLPLWQEQLGLFLLPMAMLRYAPRLHYKALQMQPIMHMDIAKAAEWKTSDCLKAAGWDSIPRFMTHGRVP